MAEKALVVVESPSKAKTIKKYLGDAFDVRASVGHVKDLPKSRMGIDIDGGFVPDYETIQGKGKVLSEIRKAAKKASMVYLAPDPDREGEAIAWHIASELKLPAERIRRVLFNEITKTAIQRALEEPLELNENRFNSQQTRRILDRLVGYQISPLLWDKVRRGLSAGRVQSVAVRIIVERERVIQAHVPEESWKISAQLNAEDSPPQLKAVLSKIGGAKATLVNEAEAKAVVDAVKNGPFRVKTVLRRDGKKSPPAPFTTSRLQQDAARAFRFTATRTMRVAQRLYEGIELGDEGAVGLITYMRTDSTRISDEALGHVRDYIGENFGADYLPAKPVVYRSKGRAQDAHEAIRPTSMNYSPERVKPYLKPEAHKLYSLIWKRFVACQMTPAISAKTTIDIEAPGEHVFRAEGSRLKFKGYLAIYQEQKSADEAPKEAQESIPYVSEGELLELANLEPTQHFSKPKPRFTEASLIRELEDKGIGRPSTYAAIISTIQKKEYAEKKESRFHPTELGTVVNDLLVESFPKLFDIGFTAQMENELDDVEHGKSDWKALLTQFWGGLHKTLEVARTEMRNVKREEIPTDITCPKDEAPLVIKFGRNGSFLACSNYPDCRFTSEFTRAKDGTITMDTDKPVGEACAECEGGDLLFKQGRYGRFIGCSNYPNCRFTRPISTGVDCPRCDGGFLTPKKSRRGKVFYSCSTYPKCDYAQWDRPIPEPCPRCKNPYLVEKSTRKGPGPIQCPVCQWERQEQKAE